MIVQWYHWLILAFSHGGIAALVWVWKELEKSKLLAGPADVRVELRLNAELYAALWKLGGCPMPGIEANMLQGAQQYAKNHKNHSKEYGVE